MRESEVTAEAAEPTLNIWYAIQTRRRRRIHRNIQPNVICNVNNKPRRGTTESSLSDQDSLNNNHRSYKFSNGKTVWGHSPEPIDERSVYRHYGGNINGIKPFGEHLDLISGIKNLRNLQAGGLSLIETYIK
jgi:hypothetical protein